MTVDVKAAFAKLEADLKDAGVQTADIITGGLEHLAALVTHHGTPVAASPAIASLASGTTGNTSHNPVNTTPKSPNETAAANSGSTSTAASDLEPNPNAPAAQAAAGTSAA